jgi:hypothetical protein
MFKIGMTSDKDTEAVLMRAYFSLVRARRYLFIDEAWMADVSNFKEDPERVATVMRYAQLGRLKEHPDRREVVMFVGEDISGECVQAHRYILRPERGKATLSPLTVRDGKGDESHGRFVNMLRESRA